LPTLDDTLQDDDQSDGDSNNQSLELVSGLTFTSWNEFKNWLDRFALKEGFDYKIRTSEKDQGIIRRITYECTMSGSHNPQVTSDPTKRRNACSSRVLCPWKLNVTYPKKSGVVKINSFNNHHNHPLTLIIHEIAPRFRKLTPEMLVDIEKYVIQGRMDSASIYPLLKHDFPDQPIYKKDLYNAVYQFRQKNNPGNTDASQMLQQLLEWKDLEPLWIVKPRLEPFSRKLNSLFWMSPIQRELYSKYNDVVILDTTYNTNRFQLMLCVITVIDNNYKTRIVGCAIIEDETLNTYRWILDTLLTDTGVYPGVIFTDSDPSMIQSIKEIYPDTQHLLCIFHIDLNLRKKLKGKLGNKFEEFRHKFYTCRNSLCEDLFELRWNQLIEQYSAATKYLTDTLYINKESWAIPWIRKRFTTGAQSTQRIESINRHIHDKVDRATSLCDLLHSIKDHVKNEEYLEKFEIERNALPKIGMPMLNTRFFSQMDAVIKDFLTPIMLGKQRSQMNESVCYDANQIIEWQQLIEASSFFRFCLNVIL
jgi:MULE transposase domain/FAR1 DNA-binding domain